MCGRVSQDLMFYGSRSGHALALSQIYMYVYKNGGGSQSCRMKIIPLSWALPSVNISLSNLLPVSNACI